MDQPSLTRRQLYDLVWKEPVQALAARFGLSDRGLAKLCERNAIPTPPRGYWARKQAGQKVVRAPLIELDRPNGSVDFPVMRIPAASCAWMKQPRFRRCASPRFQFLRRARASTEFRMLTWPAKPSMPTACAPS